MKIEPIKIETIKYPKEEIEHLVDQIIKVVENRKHSEYCHEMDETLRILNDGLKLLVKPVLILNDNFEGFKK